MSKICKKIKNKMKVLVTLLIFMSLLFTITVESQHQKTCTASPEAELEDLMTITKCAVKIKDEKDNKNKKMLIKVVGSKIKRARIKRKRALITNNSKAKGVESISIELQKQKIISSELIKNLSKKISAQEIAQSVPLTAVKNIPVFPKCLEYSKNENPLDCFLEQLTNHIQKYLRYPSEAVDKKIEGDVWVRFIINKKGEVSNIEVRGPKNGKSLEDEAKYIMAKLPLFKPGIYNGKPINIKYAFPISFKIDNEG